MLAGNDRNADKLLLCIGTDVEYSLQQGSVVSITRFFPRCGSREVSFSRDLHFRVAVTRMLVIKIGRYEVGLPVLHVFTPSVSSQTLDLIAFLVH
jgi:hypothetical protein